MNVKSRNDKICALRSIGVGPREIARRLDVSPSVVAGVLFRAGLTSAETGSGRGNGATLEYKKLVVAELGGGTWRGVAAKHGINISTLGKWRRAVAA